MLAVDVQRKLAVLVGVACVLLAGAQPALALGCCQSINTTHTHSKPYCCCDPQCDNICTYTVDTWGYTLYCGPFLCLGSGIVWCGNSIYQTEVDIANVHCEPLCGAPCISASTSYLGSLPPQRITS